MLTKDNITETTDTSENVDDKFEKGLKYFLIPLEDFYNHLLIGPFKISFWMTNVTVAIISFYIAFLINLRSGEVYLNNWYYKTPLILSILSLAIGIIIRVRYELIGYKRKVKKLLKSFELLLNTENREVNYLGEEERKQFSKLLEKVNDYNHDIPVISAWLQLLLFIFFIDEILRIIWVYLFS